MFYKLIGVPLQSTQPFTPSNIIKFFLPQSSIFINMLYSILPQKISTQRVRGNCWTSRCNINISTVPKVTIKVTTMYQLQRNKVLNEQQ